MIEGVKKVREWLKEIRTKKGLTQKEAAALLNITQSYYNMVETGERQQKMTLDIANKISKVFDVPIEFILKKENEK